MDIFLDISLDKKATMEQCIQYANFQVKMRDAKIISVLIFA